MDISVQYANRDSSRVIGTAEAPLSTASHAGSTSSSEGNVLYRSRCDGYQHRCCCRVSDMLTLITCPSHRTKETEAVLCFAALGHVVSV